MPRQIITTVYTFDELSDKAKEKAIYHYSDINVDYDWWDCIYEDALQVGITITSFDLDRARDCQANIYNPRETAEMIIDNHGDCYDTWKISRKFLDTVNPLVERLDRITDIENRWQYTCKWDHGLYDTGRRLQDTIDDLEDAYCKDIREEYVCILQREYEYLTSDIVIIETIISNGYEFTEVGEMI